MKQKVLLYSIIALFLFCGTGFAQDSNATINYNDITLIEWGSLNFPEVWDLTKCNLIFTYTIDLSGQATGGWTPVQVGLREEGEANSDPNGYGGWMQSTWQDPNTDPNLADIDDHFLLVNHGWLSDELHYDVDENGDIVSPFGIYIGYAFWFDRDGVDEWQAAYWNYKDGITYNTAGVYDVVITYQAVAPVTGTMMATINGEEQGFYEAGYQSTDPPDRQPVGRSFSGDMAQMQVFLGRGGGGGSVTVSDISVTGCPVFDTVGECISTLININCSGLKGRDRANCNHDQQEYCHWFFDVPSKHNK